MGGECDITDIITILKMTIYNKCMGSTIFFSFYWSRRTTWKLNTYNAAKIKLYTNVCDGIINLFRVFYIWKYRIWHYAKLISKRSVGLAPWLNLRECTCNTNGCPSRKTWLAIYCIFNKKFKLISDLKMCQICVSHQVSTTIPTPFLRSDL